MENNTKTLGHEMAFLMRISPMKGRSFAFWRIAAASAILILCLMSLFLPERAEAQGAGIFSSSYLTPFPPGDRYQVRVIGDWLGNGLASGLQDAFKQEPSVQIVNGSQSGFGLVRGEQSEVFGEVDKIVNSGGTQIAIVMLGINDRLPMRVAGTTTRLQPGSQEWKDAYGKEAERLIKKLKAGNISVYWVGLPIMSNPASSEIMAAINDAVRQACYLNGVKFIETWTGFTDQLGGYSAYGPDLTGQTKRLRESDGISMTEAGNKKLANYVEIVLRRDITQARSQRNIPLAGDEEEQARVVPGAAKPPAKSATGLEPQLGSPPSEDNASPVRQSTDSARKKSGGQSTPAAESVRQDQAAFSGGYQQGELILKDLGNGLTAIAVISPVNDFSVRDIQMQTPLAERLYYRVLSKGEALPPKEGRADDFTWRGGASTQAR